MRDEVRAAKKVYEDLDKEYQAELAKVLALMDEEGLQRFDSDDCFASTRETNYVTIPHNEDEKKKLFQWLDERNVFYDYATVNYQSLQALWGREQEAGREIPGIQEPKTRRNLVLYKKRKTK